MVKQRDLPARFASPLFGLSGGDLANSTGVQTPYNAPTYFPPAYFSGGGADSSSVPNPNLGQTPYNAPTYFPPTYFYGGPAGPTSLPTPPSRIPGRDGGCYDALLALLEAIDGLDSVIFGDPTRRSVAGADAYPLAVVTPKGWEETDDTDPTLWVRRVSFTIRLVIRVEEDASPFDRLDQLAAAVQVRVDRSDLNGQCLPPLTKIRAGRYQSSPQYPEWSVDLDGEFTLLIDPTADPLVF